MLRPRGLKLILTRRNAILVLAKNQSILLRYAGQLAELGVHAELALRCRNEVPTGSVETPGSLLRCPSIFSKEDTCQSFNMISQQILWRTLQNDNFVTNSTNTNIIWWKGNSSPSIRACSAMSLVAASTLLITKPIYFVTFP